MALKMAGRDAKGSRPFGSYRWVRQVFLQTVVVLHCAGLSGATSSVSLQSVNFPTYYLAPCPTGGGVEHARMCVISYTSLATTADATFSVVAGLSNASLVSFASQSPSYTGYYISINNQLTGTCASSYSAPSSDVVLASPVPHASATWGESKSAAFEFDIS